MNEIEQAITVLEKEYAKIKFQEPWYQDIFNEVSSQILIFGNVIDIDKVRDIIDEKMLVWP